MRAPVTMTERRRRRLPTHEEMTKYQATNTAVLIQTSIVQTPFCPPAL